MTPRFRLGDLLVQGGLAQDDLDAALAVQTATGERLGRILRDKGLLSAVALQRALAHQAGVKFADLDDLVIDWAVASSVPPALARRHLALPVARLGDRIVVAMVNPADVFAIDDLRAVTGHPISPVLAEHDQLLACIDRLATADGELAAAIHLAVQETDVRVVEADVAAVGMEDAPIVRFVELMLTKAVDDRASDVHVEPGADGLRIRFRIDGVLHDAMTSPSSLQAGIVSRLKVMADIDISERRLPQDGRTSIAVGGRAVDLRVATVPTVHGEAVVLRILDKRSQSVALTDAGFLPATLERLVDAYQAGWGAVLVTGPTGSGKTTTLYGALSDLNTPDRNLMTIEDPVEYRIDGVKQVQVNPKAGLTFANALRAFLRADPDVILVGEIRDEETARMAAEASLTGHLVLSTLHTNDAASTPLRLLEIGVEPFLVTSAVRAVLAQRLARRLCDRCKEPLESSEQLLAAGWTYDGGEAPTIFRAVGCPACSRTGYRGRLAIHELMLMSEDISRLVLTRSHAAEVSRQAVEEGMVTLRQDGLRKVAAGSTTLEELARLTS